MVAGWGVSWGHTAAPFRPRLNNGITLHCNQIPRQERSNHECLKTFWRGGLLHRSTVLRRFSNAVRQSTGRAVRW